MTVALSYAVVGVICLGFGIAVSAFCLGSRD
jgi:hypothetical protein